MKRFVLLDTTPIPDNGGALCLFEYGEDFVIKIQGGDGGQLMNTRMHGSEDALAEIPCRKVAGRPGSRVLIGGLGMGFTLAAALKHPTPERKPPRGVRYHDPATGQTWTGRGLQPAWLRAALGAGGKLADFEVQAKAKPKAEESQMERRGAGDAAETAREGAATAAGEAV